MGLFEAVLGWGRQTLFPGYQGALADCRRLPINLQKDAWALVEWAISGLPIAGNEVHISSKKIESHVRQMRSSSDLGRHFLNRARRLKRLYPELPKAKWGASGATHRIMQDEVGKPLTERVVSLAATFRPKFLQIVQHDAYLNSTWTCGVLTIRLNDDAYTVKEITLAAPEPKQSKTPAQRRFEGELIDFFETGTEGVIWMLEDDSRFGRAALEAICEGDHLMILDALGNIVWRGVIRCDKKIGFRPYPMNPEYGQQCALGHWVHWIQEGFEPDEWAKFFIRPDYDRLRGILVRKPGHERNPRLGPESA